MKNIILSMAALALVSFGMLELGITETERKMAADHLLKTQKRLTSTLDGLSKEQLNFKISQESWSISECVEHLAISENMLHGLLQRALQAQADPMMRDSVSMTDKQLIAMINSRDQKAKALKDFEPSGKFGSHEETLKAFTAKRQEHIEYINTTEDDLRNHYTRLPFATIDGLQIMLFMSGHTERHVKQMEEVMAHEDFPSE